MTRCGIGVVDGAPGRQLTLVDVQVVRTPSGLDVGERLVALAEALGSAIARYSPDVVAVERVFSQHNVRTVMGTAQAGAVAIVCAARRGLPVTAALTSLGVCIATGRSRRAAASIATALAWAVPMTVRTLCWLNTRSTATASGR